MIEAEGDYVWTNQYANEANPEAHAHHTAREIHRNFPHLECLFVGAGTTGTLEGCARYFGSIGHRARIVAVDSKGSVTFGHPPGKRYIPGLGTSRRPEIFTGKGIDHLYMIPEVDTVRMAREIFDRYSLLVGGSTATVLCGVAEYVASHAVTGSVVAISPDFGDKYMDTLYNPDWVAERFPHLAVVMQPELALGKAA
jgi:cysteine synthase A